MYSTRSEGRVLYFIRKIIKIDLEWQYRWHFFVTVYSVRGITYLERKWSLLWQPPTQPRLNKNRKIKDWCYCSLLEVIHIVNWIITWNWAMHLLKNFINHDKSIRGTFVSTKHDGAVSVLLHKEIKILIIMQCTSNLPAGGSPLRASILVKPRMRSENVIVKKLEEIV